MTISPNTYSRISKTIQVVSLIIFFILLLFTCKKVLAHVDLVDVRTPDIDKFIRDVDEKEEREASNDGEVHEHMAQRALDSSDRSG